MKAKILVTLGWLMLFVALIVGLPLWLRMPPWCDLTLYDQAAANLLRGGVHYQDLFDTNLPGFVWLLTGVQYCFGPSIFVVRVVDFLIVASIVVLSWRISQRGQANLVALVWSAAACAWFYLFTTEFNHAQRDVWMLCPALAAIYLNFRQVCYASNSPFSGGFLQGLLWASAIWIKPHVLVVVLIVWLASSVSLVRLRGLRYFVNQSFGLLAGGLCLGAIGVGELMRSGAWPAFLDVLTNWNPGYVQVMQLEFSERCLNHFKYFAPWTYAQLIAWPIAVLTVVDGYGAKPMVSRRLSSRLWTPPESSADEPQATDLVRYARLLFAVFYLAWTFQALLCQRGFHYVHVPEILLLFFLVATQRWLVGAFLIGWCLLTTCIVCLGWHPDQTLPGGRVLRDDPNIWCIRHPITDPQRLACWPQCWAPPTDDAAERQLWQRLGMIHDFFPANNWDELYEVATELRNLGTQDGEVIAWNDAPHAVYRMIGVKPHFRFMHVRAMMSISKQHEERIMQELADALPGTKYIVSDLMWLGHQDPYEIKDRHEPGPDLLPPSISEGARSMFPYHLPAIFRSKSGTGRYLIHRVVFE